VAAVYKFQFFNTPDPKQELGIEGEWVICIGCGCFGKKGDMVEDCQSR